jgi:hypothetical protein
MVRPAARLQVLVRRRASVGDGVDVIPFEPVTPPTVWLGTNGPFEARRSAELQRGTQLCGDVAAEVLYGGDTNTVVEHCLDECIIAQFAHPLDRQRPASPDLAHFAGMGVAAPVGVEIGHQD